MSADTIHAAYEQFLGELIDARLLIPSGVRGVYGRSGTFEHIIDRFEDLVGRETRSMNAEVIRFPPVFNREHYCGTDHIYNFPDLMGSVHSFTGCEADHQQLLQKFEQREDWSRDLAATQVMLAPAACYPLYPSATGTLPKSGRLVDLKSFVFRHEPSDDPARMQSFRMREFVRLGSPEQALAHRDFWLEKAGGILRSLGLPVEAVVANDPFFGRGGRVMKATQREQNLKFELVVPICSEEKPTAITSCNYHLDHFGSVFDIRTADGKTAHSACMGFGLERIALALLKHHGLDPAAWPASVRNQLRLDD